MVTKEEIEKAMNQPWSEELCKTVIKNLLAERDAYREVAANIQANKDRDLPIFAPDENDYKKIDAEAVRILKK